MTVPPRPAADAVFVGAGDIAACGRLEHEYTARLLDRIPGTVFHGGRQRLPGGLRVQLLAVLRPAWGRHLWRTLATAGNHDFQGDGGASYYAYFGAAAGPSGLGYDSHTLGAWHVVTLNSMLPSRPARPVRMAAAGPRRLGGGLHRRGLAPPAVQLRPERGTTRSCATSGRWLVQRGVDIVVNGDDHVYERFAPRMQRPGRRRAASGNSPSARAATSSTTGARPRRTARCSRTARTAC